MKNAIIPLLMILILFSGCVKLNTTEELKRNGLMNVIVIFDSSYFTISDLVNSSITPNPNLNPISERVNNTLIYYFSNVNPFESDLFVNSGENEYLGVNPSGFLGSNTFKYSTEFKFPYYYYYYTADFGNASIQGDDVFNKSYLLDLAQNYTIDYDVIYFGELVSTNGQEISDKKIRFSPQISNDYELTFREFFLINWLKRLTE